MKIPHDYSAEKWDIPPDIQAEYADFEQRVWDSQTTSIALKGEISDHLVELKLLKRNHRDRREFSGKFCQTAVEALKHFQLPQDTQAAIDSHQKHAEASKHANFGTY